MGIEEQRIQVMLEVSIIQLVETVAALKSAARYKRQENENVYADELEDVINQLNKQLNKQLNTEKYEEK